MEKNEIKMEGKAGWVGSGCHLKGVVGEGITGKVTLKQSLEGGKRVSSDDLEGEHSKRKQPVQKQEKCVLGMLKE